MKKAFLISFFVTLVAILLLQSCSAEWAVCETCEPGEESAETDDGRMIPVVVIVNVNVNQSQNNMNMNMNTYSYVDAGTTSAVDAGTTEEVDAGLPVVDAGMPEIDAGVSHDAGSPGKDAGCTTKCRKVCTHYKPHYVCVKSNKQTDNKEDCKDGVKHVNNKCYKEELQCK